MVKQGSAPSAEELPYFERVDIVNPGLSLPNASTGNTYRLGTYTMLWPGSLSVQAMFQCSWTGFQQVIITASAATSPAPAIAGSFETTIRSDPGCWTMAACNLSWLGLTAAQVVTIDYRIDIGGGGPAVSISILDATYRAFRS